MTICVLLLLLLLLDVLITYPHFWQWLDIFTLDLVYIFGMITYFWYQRRILVNAFLENSRNLGQLQLHWNFCNNSKAMPIYKGVWEYCLFFIFDQTLFGLCQCVIHTIPWKYLLHCTSSRLLLQFTRECEKPSVKPFSWNSISGFSIFKLC